jgi:hypothetical protein
MRLIRTDSTIHSNVAGALHSPKGGAGVLTERRAHTVTGYRAGAGAGAGASVLLSTSPGTSHLSHSCRVELSLCLL